MTNKAISPLRRRMIDDMTIRQLAPKTQVLVGQVNPSERECWFALAPVSVERWACWGLLGCS